MLPEGSKDPAAVIPFQVDQYLEVMFSWDNTAYPTLALFQLSTAHTTSSVFNWKEVLEGSIKLRLPDVCSHEAVSVHFSFFYDDGSLIVISSNFLYQTISKVGNISFIFPPNSEGKMKNWTLLIEWKYEQWTILSKQKEVTFFIIGLAVFYGKYFLVGETIC